MANSNLKLTSVKIVDHLFDEEFRKQIHNHTALTISGSL